MFLVFMLDLLLGQLVDQITPVPSRIVLVLLPHREVADLSSVLDNASQWANPIVDVPHHLDSMKLGHRKELPPPGSAGCGSILRPQAGSQRAMEFEDPVPEDEQYDIAYPFSRFSDESSTEEGEDDLWPTYYDAEDFDEFWDAYQRYYSQIANRYARGPILRPPFGFRHYNMDALYLRDILVAFSNRSVHHFRTLQEMADYYYQDLNYLDLLDGTILTIALTRHNQLLHTYTVLIFSREFYFITDRHNYQIFDYNEFMQRLRDLSRFATAIDVERYARRPLTQVAVEEYIGLIPRSF